MNKPKILAYLLYGLSVPYSLASYYSPSHSSPLPIALLIAEVACLLVLIYSIHKERETYDFAKVDSVLQTKLSWTCIYTAQLPNWTRQIKGSFIDKSLFDIVPFPSTILQLILVSLVSAIGLTWVLFNYVTVTGEILRVSRDEASEVNNNCEPVDVDSKKAVNKKLAKLICYAVPMILIPIAVPFMLGASSLYAGGYVISAAFLAAFTYELINFIQMDAFNCHLWKRVAGLTSGWIFGFGIYIPLCVVYLFPESFPEMDQYALDSLTYCLPHMAMGMMIASVLDTYAPKKWIDALPDRHLVLPTSGASGVLSIEIVSEK